MKTKIFFFYPHLKFWMGGTRFLIDISKYLNKKYELYFVVSGKNKKNEKKFSEFGKIITLSKFTTNDFFYWILFPFFLLFEFLIAYIKIKKIINKNSIFIGVSFPSNFFAWYLSNIFKKNYYFLCYEPYPFFYKSDLVKKYNFFKKTFVLFLKFFYSPLDKLSAKNAKKIITLDQFKAKEVINVYKIKPEIIGVGVDFNIFNKTSIKIKLGIYEEIFNKKTVFINSNDYSELKNLDILLKSFKLLTDEVKNCHLFITSTQPDSPRKKIYEKIAKDLNIYDKVTFLGFLSQKELSAFYAKSYCYVSSNYNEITAGDWPVKEALACGTPAIRSKIGTKDVIHKKTGYVYNNLDPEEIKKAMIWVIKNKKTLERYKKLRRKVIEHNYKWENVYKNFEKIILN